MDRKCVLLLPNSRKIVLILTGKRLTLAKSFTNRDSVATKVMVDIRQFAAASDLPHKVVTLVITVVLALVVDAAVFRGTNRTTVHGLDEAVAAVQDTGATTEGQKAVVIEVIAVHATGSKLGGNGGRKLDISKSSTNSITTIISTIGRIIMRLVMVAEAEVQNRQV